MLDVMDDIRSAGRKLWRGFGVSVVFALVGGGLWWWQERDYQQFYVWQGVPQARALDWKTLARGLRSDAYLVGWSDLRANPLWVTWRLENTQGSRLGERPDEFERDWRSLWPVTPDSYRNSGYDRGHLAPNYAIGKIYGVKAQHQTFRMTNISPQTPALNRKLWQRLEAAIMDSILPREGALWITAGPVFSGSIERLPNLIEIPDAFYKIIISPGSGLQAPRALAFLFPQQVRGDEPLDRFLVSIDRIESLTGLDFFHELPDDVEQRLEAQVVRDGWQVDSFSRTPSRY